MKPKRKPNIQKVTIINKTGKILKGFIIAVQFILTTVFYSVILTTAGCGPTFYPGLYHSGMPTITPPAKLDTSYTFAADYNNSTQFERGDGYEKPWTASQNVKIGRLFFEYGQGGSEFLVLKTSAKVSLLGYYGSNQVNSTYDTEESGDWRFWALGVQGCGNLFYPGKIVKPGIGANFIASFENGKYIRNFFGRSGYVLPVVYVYPFLQVSFSEFTLFTQVNLFLPFPIIIVPLFYEYSFGVFLGNAGVWFNMRWDTMEYDNYENEFKIEGFSFGISFSLPDKETDADSIKVQNSDIFDE